MKEKDIYSELASIRNLMERSTKFISLSGLSGILAGIYACAGAIAGVLLVSSTSNRNGFLWGSFELGDPLLLKLFFVAVAVLALSILTGVWLTIRKAKKKGDNVWNPVSRRLLYSMMVPLVTGGLLTLVFLFRGYYEIIAPSTLVFYGLSLVAVSQYTFNEVKWLGFLEIVLGLMAACFPGYGLVFWIIGFGLLHIIYGSVMHIKYDR